MSIIYRTSDTISVKIGDITIKVSPLTYAQKEDVQAQFYDKKIVGAGRLAIKYAVKGIEGMFLYDGAPYSVEKESGVLTDSCVDDLMNMEHSVKLIQVCSALLNNVPTEIVDPKGKKIKGIEIMRPAPGN